MYAKNVNDTKSVKLKYPLELWMQFSGVEIINMNKEVYGYVSKRRKNACKQPNQIREALTKGYVEMGQINLSICKECLHAEYEAEHTLERLVSGG